MKLAAFSLIVILLLSLAGCKKESTSEPPPSTSETEPNDLASQANPLGTLGATDLQIGGVASSTNDVDRFSVIVPAAANMLASVSWQGAGDLDVAIQNASGINLTSRDSGLNPESCTLAITPATYIVQVTSKSTTAIAYTLTVGQR